MSATMKSLEVQIGQLASYINATQRGKLPSNIEINPKDQCKIITLQSGEKLKQRVKKVELFRISK